MEPNHTDTHDSTIATTHGHVTSDDERPTDPDADDVLPDHLDVDPEVPVPDVIDQRRAVVLDDELGP